MEIFALIAVLVCEIGLAVYCVITKSIPVKASRIARLGLFTTFAVLALTSVVQWGWRWYAFGVLLLGFAIPSLFGLLRKNERVPIYNAKKNIGQAALRIGIAAFTLLPVIIFPQVTPIATTGEYPVATLVDTYTDSNRIETYTDLNEHRKITVQYWYPKDTEGPFPLIVFSHGSLGLRTSNETLYRELASHGYVVCAIDHTFQSIFSTDVNGNTTLVNSGFVREVSAEDAHTNKAQSFAFYQKWINLRAGDINFVIDAIMDGASYPASEMVFRLVDPSKIGLIGHSLGGSAVLAVGRMRSDIGVVMALEAPFMGDILGVENGEFVWNEAAYPVPVMNIYTDSSWSHLGEWSQYAKNAQLLSSEDADVYNVYLQGARHLTLTDLSLSSPLLARVLNGQPASMDPRECLARINALALDLFDTYLKHESEISGHR